MSKLGRLIGYKNLLVTVSDDVLKGVKRKITGSISIGFERKKGVSRYTDYTYWILSNYFSKQKTFINFLLTVILNFFLLYASIFLSNAAIQRINHHISIIGKPTALPTGKSLSNG